MKRTVVLAWAAAFLLACGSGTSPPVSGDDYGTGSSGGRSNGGGNGSSSGGTASSTTGSSGSGSGSTSSGSGTVTGGFTFNGWIDDAVSGDPLQSVQVCLLASPAVCTTTDVNGTIALSGLGPSQDGITATLSGYPTGIWPITPTGNISGWTIFLRSDTRLATLAQQVGGVFGGSLGAIVFEAYDGSDNDLSGVSVSTGSGGTIGYFAGDGTGLNSTLTATTSNGGGYIFAVPPGDVDVTFSAPGLVCARSGSEGWPGSGSGTVTIPVRAGELTRAAGACQ